MYLINPDRHFDDIVDELDAMGSIAARITLNECMSAAIAHDDSRAVMIFAMAHCLWFDAPVTERVGLAMAGLVRKQGVPAGKPKHALHFSARHRN